jgi:hypothetical protein
LPSGYTHWAYAAAVKIDGSGNLLKTRVKGAAAFFESVEELLNNGSATTETLLSLTGVIPVNALTAQLILRGSFSTNSGGSAETRPEIRVISGSKFASMNMFVAASGSVRNAMSVEIPNISRTMYYLFANEINPTNISLRAMTIELTGYTIPNGGE